MTKERKVKRRPKKLNVAHVVVVTPGRCGMYESARELVLAERKLGINAQLVDLRPYEKDVKGKKKLHCKEMTCPKCGEVAKVVLKEEAIPHRPGSWEEDRGVCIAPPEFAYDSDVIVSHSGVDALFKTCPTPRIHIAHGRPNSSYRIERSGEVPIYSMYKEMASDDRWKWMVTLWPGFEHYWRLIFPRVRVINSFVDLDYWKPMEVEYKFDNYCDLKNEKITKGEPQGGDINVICADIWRKDKDPFHVINAFAVFAEQYTCARLHVYGIDPNGRGRDTILACLRERGVLGEVLPMVKHLKEVYNAGDILITPHNIATRTVREGLACGMQVVAGPLNPYTPYMADPEDALAYAGAIADAWKALKRNRGLCQQRNRETAEREFDVNRAAVEFKKLFEEIIGRAA